MISEVRKRLKPDDALQKFRTKEGHLPKDKSLLPAEIWHHIFTFCPPRVLGRFLQVKKSFNAYLDPSSPGLSVDPLSTSAVLLLSPDTIWRASRQVINLHGLPAPLSGKSELDMWKISCGSLCQFCGKTGQTSLAVLTDQWHPGPGEDGVVPIWPFGVRTCGSCLQKQSTKVGLSSIAGGPSTTDEKVGNRFTSFFLHSITIDGRPTLHLPHKRAPCTLLCYTAKWTTSTFHSHHETLLQPTDRRHQERIRACQSYGVCHSRGVVERSRESRP